MLIDLVRRVLETVGYRIERTGRPLRSHGEYLKDLSGVFSPAVIFDVGVAHGTPGLYSQFFGARVVLMDPLVEFEPYMRSIAERHNGVYFVAAAGAEEGHVSMAVGADMRKSSVRRERLQGKEPSSRRRVPVRTIDSIVDQEQLQGPFLIKVDVEGAELDVIAGASRTLEATEVVILEVSLYDPENTTPEFVEVINAMKGHGFVPHDIVGAALSRTNHGLSHADVAFVKDRGIFRARSWEV